MNGILDVRFWIMDYGLRRSSCGGLLVTGVADFGLESIFVFRAHKVGELLLCRQLSSEFSW